MRKVQQGDRPILPAFAIEVDRKPLPPEIASQVQAVTVDDDIGLPRMCSFDLAACEDHGTSAGWVDDARFAIGLSVQVKLSAPENPATVFQGEITALEPDFGLDHLPNLTVRAYDRLHRLQRHRATRTFTQQKDSEVAATIASAAGLRPTTVDSGVTHDYLVQANQTDFEFLAERATRIGYALRVEGDELHFEPLQGSRGAAITLAPTSGLLAFRPRLTAAGQVDEVGLRRWSVKDKAQAPGTAGTGDQGDTMGGRESGATLAKRKFGTAAESLTAWAVASQAEADQLTRARLRDHALDFITGEGVCWGRGDLRAGLVVRIVDIGERFSGTYLLSRVSHRYGPQGYLTEFSVRRNAS